MAIRGSDEWRENIANNMRTAMDERVRKNNEKRERALAEESERVARLESAEAKKLQYKAERSAKISHVVREAARVKREQRAAEKALEEKALEFVRQKIDTPEKAVEVFRQAVQTGLELFNKPQVGIAAKRAALCHAALNRELEAWIRSIEFTVKRRSLVTESITNTTVRFAKYAKVGMPDEERAEKRRLAKEKRKQEASGEAP